MSPPPNSLAFLASPEKLRAVGAGGWGERGTGTKTQASRSWKGGQAKLGQKGNGGSGRMRWPQNAQPERGLWWTEGGLHHAVSLPVSHNTFHPGFSSLSTYTRMPTPQTGPEDRKVRSGSCRLERSLL